MKKYTVVFFIAFLVIGIASTQIGTTLSFLTKRYSIPIEQGGVLLTLFTLGATGATFATGFLLDRYNSRSFGWSGPALVGFGLLALHFLDATWTPFLAIPAMGFGFGVMLVCGNVLVARINPENPASQLNVLNIFFGIGAIVGPQVVNFAIGQGTVTLGYVLAGGASLVLALLVAPISVPPPARPTRSGARLPALPMALALFILLNFIYTGSEIGFGAWIFTQLTQVTLLAASTATIAVSLFWLGLTAGRMMGGILARFLPAEWLLVGATVVFFGSVCLLLALPTEPTISIVSTFLVGFGAGPVFPTSIALVNSRYPSMAGAASGLLITAGSLGGGVIPWLHGQVGRGDNGGMTVTLTATILLIGLALLITRQLRPAPQMDGV